MNRIPDNTTCPQQQFFLEVYHGKKRQLAALQKQAEALEDQRKGLEQEIAGARKLAGIAEKTNS